MQVHNISALIELPMCVLRLRTVIELLQGNITKFYFRKICVRSGADYYLLDYFLNLCNESVGDASYQKSTVR